MRRRTASVARDSTPSLRDKGRMNSSIGLSYLLQTFCLASSPLFPCRVDSRMSWSSSIFSSHLHGYQWSQYFYPQEGQDGDRSLMIILWSINHRKIYLKAPLPQAGHIFSSFFFIAYTFITSLLNLRSNLIEPDDEAFGDLWSFLTCCCRVEKMALLAAQAPWWHPKTTSMAWF